ncbi:hypothetical protein KPH14_006196 [Odynerus spinipes]|uniref:TOG domain-containing protein n=1 Tax=Odynerus spinipes TaxID=1348599 RepID=A0AAD9RIW5_9HYME|nr:hypothetical protein KPH14_006196 [Odynerus spinipes]
MIFKYCVWSNETKEDNRLDDVKRSEKEHNLAGTVLRCCPCVFRCRRSIGIGNENDDQSVSTIISNADTTPVIAVRLHRSTDTIDKAPVNEEEFNERTNNYYLPEANAYSGQVLKNEDSPHEDHERARSRSAGSTSSDVSASNSNVKRERSISQDRRDYDSDSNSNSVKRENNKKAFDVISRKSEGRDTVDSYVLPPKESESSASVESTSTSDEASKDWSSEDGIKARSEVLSDEVTNANSESSDGVDDLDKNLETRGRSIISIISSEEIINEVLASSNESSEANYTNFGKSSQDASSGSPSKHSGSPIRSGLEYSNHAINTNDSNSDLFGSPRRDSQSPPLSPSFEDHINEILGDANGDDIIPTTFHDEAAILQTLEREKSGSLEKIAEYVDNVGSIEQNVESGVNEDINVSIENISVYDTTEVGVTSVAFTKISNPLESFTKLDDIRNDLEHEKAPAILKIEPQPVGRIEQPIKRIPSKVPRNTTRSRIVSHNKTSQYSEKTGEKYKPTVQQCFNQLESKDWEVTIKGLQSLSQLVKQNPEYLDINIGGTIGRLLGRHIGSLRSQVARAACIAAGDIFSSQIRGIEQDVDDIAGPLLHRTADTNRFLRADSNAALDRMVEFLPPHRIISIIVLRGANHQNAVVRGTTARLLSSIVDRIGAEHAMSLSRDVRDKLIGTGAKLLMDGNLEARNHAKKMFSRLAHCEGFRKALTDAVPETTLRHIDKTLKSL